MKKTSLLLALLAVTTIGISSRELQASAAGPEIGSKSKASYFAASFFDYGAERLDDRGMYLTMASDWGVRGSVQKTYNLNDFSMSINASEIPGNNALVIVFASTKDAYIGTGGQLIMDIVKSTTNNNLCMVTCATTAHNASIDGFTSGGVWADDANYTGVQVETTDGNIEIAFKTNGESTSVTVNSTAYTVATSTIFSNMTDRTNIYVSMGCFNGGGRATSWKINKIEDASDRTYFATNGIYYTTKTKIEDLYTLASGDLSTQEKIDAAQAAYDEISFDGLQTWDVNYISEKYNQSKEKIDAAVKAIGPTAIVSKYEKAITTLKEKNKSLTTAEQVLDAKKQLDAVQVAKVEVEEIDLESLTSELSARIENANADLLSETTKLTTAAKTVYEAKVQEYETIVNDLSTTEKQIAASQTYNNIPRALNVLFTEEENTAFDARITTAKEQYGKGIRQLGEGWISGSKTMTAKEGEVLGLNMVGGALGVAPTDGSAIIYTKEKLSVSNFEMKFSVKNICEATGAWLSFGIMEKPELFSNADDISCQDNKGVFFLITKYSSTELNVEAYILSMTSNRFFDAILQTKVQIPYADEITVKFSEVAKSIAGVNETYFEMNFNDKNFNADNVKASKLLTVLGAEKEGYLYFASSGASSQDPNTVKISSINGKSPFAETLRVAVPKIPTSTDSQKSFRLGTETNLSLNFDGKGLDITSLKVGDKELTTTDYSYESGKITLNNTFLNTLTVGDKEIVISTADGKVTIKLIVLEKIAGDETGKTSDPATSDSKTSEGGSSKSGCKGEVGVGLLGGLGLLLSMAVALKNKKSKNSNK